MINLHNNTITTNKRKLCYLLTIPFLTLTNIPNIIFSYDNDVFAMAVDSSRGNSVYFSKEEDDQLRRLVEQMEQKIGLLLQNKCLEGLQDNVEKDGLMFLLQEKKNGL